MLVVPITAPSDDTTGLASAEGYVPAGTWTDLFTHQQYTGPAVVKFYRNKFQYPVLVRSGGIVPLADDAMAAIDDLPEAMTVTLFPWRSNMPMYYMNRQRLEKRKPNFLGIPWPVHLG